MFSNDTSKKDKTSKLSNSTKGVNLVETNNKIKDKKPNQGDNILDNILNADGYRYKSNLLSNELLKNELG